MQIRKQNWDEWGALKNNHSYQFIKMNEKRSKILLNLKKAEMRDYVSCATGHGKDKFRLSFIFQIASLECRLCKGHTENMQHLLLDCQTTSKERKKWLGSEIMTVQDFHEKHPKKILNFIYNSRLGEIFRDDTVLTKKDYINKRKIISDGPSTDTKNAKIMKIDDYFLPVDKILEREKLERERYVRTEAVRCKLSKYVFE